MRKLDKTKPIGRGLRTKKLGRIWKTRDVLKRRDLGKSLPTKGDWRKRS